MELRESYKNTEVGVIPEDWEVKELGTILTFGGGKDYKHLQNGEIPVYGTGGIMTYVDDFLHDGESVGIGRKGTIDKPVFLNGKFWTVDTLFYTHQFIDSIPKFIYYKFNLVKWKDFNEASGVPSLNKNTLEKIKISIPDLPEQTAIATALSDTDALINSLEKLISKKRNIKQGAMQKLLQPKEGWEVKKLGSIGKPYGGLSGKSKLDFEYGKYPYIPFMNIMSNPIINTGYFDYVNIGVDESQNKALKGDLFFNGSSETPEEVGMCSVLLEDVPILYLNSFCFGFRFNKDSKENGLYYSYYFRSSEGRKLFYSLAQGATRYNLSKSNFIKMEVAFPKPEEQTRIATILSDMDTEIQALETKLEKYRKIKLGMMQNLLTGKIRLV